jgi:hypothetical protein
MSRFGPSRRCWNACSSAAYGRKAEVLATFVKRRFLTDAVEKGLDLIVVPLDAALVVATTRWAAR